MLHLFVIDLLAAGSGFTRAAPSRLWAGFYRKRNFSERVTPAEFADVTPEMSRLKACRDKLDPGRGPRPAIGVGTTHWIALPLPPNRAGGSPAPGSPVDGFTFLRTEDLHEERFQGRTTPAPGAPEISRERLFATGIRLYGAFHCHHAYFLTACSIAGRAFIRSSGVITGWISM